MDLTRRDFGYAVLGGLGALVGLGNPVHAQESEKKVPVPTYEKNYETPLKTVETFISGLKASDFDGLASMVGNEFGFMGFLTANQTVDAPKHLLACFYFLAPGEVRVAERVVRREMKEHHVKIYTPPLNAEQLELLGQSYPFIAWSKFNSDKDVAAADVDINYSLDSDGKSIGRHSTGLLLKLKKDESIWRLTGRYGWMVCSNVACK